MKKTVDYQIKVMFAMAFLLIFFSFLIVIVADVFFKPNQKSFTGFGSSGSVSLVIEEWRFINVTSPLNTTYTFATVGNYTLQLNVTSNFNVDSWWYDLWDLTNNVLINNSVPFTPNTTIEAVVDSNQLIVYGNRTSNIIYNQSVVFFVRGLNRAPVIENIDAEIYVCEGDWLSYSFNVTDLDGDISTASMTPLNPFYIQYLHNINLTNNAYEIFSGLLDKNDAGGVNNGSKVYEETISVTDDEFVDSAIMNITIIEINNAPNVEDIGVQTVWTHGENSTFYHEIDVNDIEDGGRLTGDLHFNISFSNQTLFNISSVGVINYTGNLSHIGVHNITLCVTDNGILNPHDGIVGNCSQDGSNITSCDDFSLTVTDENRQPQIVSYFPLNFSLSGVGTSTFYFNLSVSDADGTIPDVRWYVDNLFKERDSGSSVSLFSYSFGCGVSGIKTIDAVVTDGELNASVQWNVSVSSVACTIGGDTGGGGGGEFKLACDEKWACEEWNQCRHLQLDYDSNKINSEVYKMIKNRCFLVGINDDKCGFQKRNCTDINKCFTNISIPGTIRECHYTEIPTCSDGIKNCHSGGCEVLVDCGGPCFPCSTCSDKIKNQGEERVDCGGPCSPCTEYPFSLKFFAIYVSLFLFIGALLIIAWLLFLFYKRRKIHTALQKKKQKEKD